MGAPRAGANCTAALAQLRPEAIPVDEDAAVVEDTVQKKGCGHLHPIEEGDVQPPSGHALKTRVEVRPPGISSGEMSKSRSESASSSPRATDP